MRLAMTRRVALRRPRPPWREALIALAVYAAAAAVPVLMTEFVDRPKTIPGPPVASMTARAPKVSTFMEYQSRAVMPRQLPSASRTSESAPQVGV